jgi:hypothetical protein
MEKETMSATYDLSISDDDVIGFESVYDAKERLLDSLDRCVGPRADYELRALLSVVEDDIRELEGEEEG